MTEPGLYDRTAAGGFTLGRIAGPPDADLRELAALLEAVGPVELTDNLLGARWSKLALNCAVSSLGTIGGERLGFKGSRDLLTIADLEVEEIVTRALRAAFPDHHVLAEEEVSSARDKTRLGAPRGK